MPPTDRHSSARTLAEANARADALLDTVEALTELVERVLADNEQLREQIAQRGKSSKSSSRPPSSDSPAQRAGREKRKGSGRPKGAQPGHPKHERARLDPDEIDETLRHVPPASCRCGGAIGVDDEPHCRHQVADLPEVTHTVTEHQLFGGTCRGCGKRHAADVPDGVPAGQMGPNLIAWIALMGGEMHLSVRQIQRLMLEQWGLSFSTGAISNAMGRASAAMARPHGQIVRAARSAPIAHADETRHPRGGGGYPGTWWMWCLATDLVVAFHVHYSRGMAAAAQLLGDFAGVLVTDDYGGYNRVPDGRRQLCWAHVLRHFAAIGERVGVGGQIGRRLELIGRAVIRTRHRLDRGEIDEPVHHRRMARLRRRFVLELERGARLRLDGRTKGQCEHLLRRESMLWTFMIDRRIPLTNNLAERNLRPHVIWRKLSHASHSRRGDEFRARVMSVVMTGRNLGIPVYEYLRRICAEANTEAGVTTLLPLDVRRLPG